MSAKGNQGASPQVTEEMVRGYLKSHKSFIEDFLLNEISVMALQKIVTKKTCRRDSAYDVASTIGDAITQLKTSQAQAIMGTIKNSVQEGIPVESVLLRLCKSTAEAVNADCFHFYIKKTNNLELIGVKDTVLAPIRHGDTIPGYVAVTKAGTIVNVLKQKGDFKFSNGSLLSAQNSLGFVLCMPILSKTGSVIGVLELGRQVGKPTFTDMDEQMVESSLSWGTVAINCSNIHLENRQLRMLFDMLHGLISKVVGCDWSFESVFESIRASVSELLGCDSVKIFMSNKTGESMNLQQPGSGLYDKIFSIKHNDECSIRDLEKQFEEEPASPGMPIFMRIVDKAIKNGEVLNLNAVSRNEFLKSDMERIFAEDNMKSVLCAPITMDKKAALGAIVAVNKKSETGFSANNQQNFSLFCELCSLVLSSCKSQREIMQLQNKYDVLNEILEYHRVFPENEFQEIKAKPLPSLDDYPINDFGMDTAKVDDIAKAQLAVSMFLDLVNPEGYDMDKFLRFSLTVSKNHRHVPFHNYDHAFAMTHTMYLILKGAPDKFSELEKVSLFVACLCHDLDHRGTGSPYLAKSGSPLSKLYTDPILENFHFSQTIALLKMDSHNIFSHLSEEDYLKALTIIKKTILATDIVQFFKNKDTMIALVSENRFSWDIPSHKDTALSLIVSLCDLNSTCKPWPIYKTRVDALFIEFYNQGDCEKDMGAHPINELFNRDDSNKIPNLQMDFNRIFPLTSCRLLEPMFPNIKPLRENAEASIAKWKVMKGETVPQASADPKAKPGKP